MVDLFEVYNVGDSYTATINATEWKAQTFTVGSTGHNITSVKLKMGRIGVNPGTLTVSIRNTDVDGHPIGEDLTVGTTNANVFSGETFGDWCEVTLAEYNLVASTKYAIVCRVLTADADNYVRWIGDITNPAYKAGNMEYSENSGVDWSSMDIDLLFEVWGYIPIIKTTNLYFDP